MSSTGMLVVAEVEGQCFDFHEKRSKQTVRIVGAFYVFVVEQLPNAEVLKSWFNGTSEQKKLGFNTVWKTLYLYTANRSGFM